MIPSVYLETAPPVPTGFRLAPRAKYYCLNSIGTVLSCRTKGGKFVAWKVMKPAFNKDRPFVGFRTGKRLNRKPIHLLVLETFVGPCPPGMHGCHNDGNPLNNSVTNLRWDTPKGNMADRVKHGTAPIGVKNPAAILTEDQVRQIRRLYRDGMQQKQIAPFYGVSKQCVQTVCSGECWSSVI